MVPEAAPDTRLIDDGGYPDSDGRTTLDAIIIDDAGGGAAAAPADTGCGHIARLRGLAIEGTQVGVLALSPAGDVGAFCLLPGFTDAVPDAAGRTVVKTGASLFAASPTWTTWTPERKRSRSVVSVSALMRKSRMSPAPWSFCGR
jgi:hypothetical protein